MLHPAIVALAASLAATIFVSVGTLVDERFTTG
jgi:hypothetical protein